MLDIHFSEKMFPKIQSKLPQVQLEVVSSCPTIHYKEMNTSLLQFMYSGRAEKFAALQLLKMSGFCSPFQPMVIVLNQLAPRTEKNLHYWFLPYFQYFLINTHTMNICDLPRFLPNTSDKIKFENKQKQN